MRIARLTNADIHWREDGDPNGAPVVFANSLGTDLRLWDKVIDRLPEEGYRYIRFDKRGHGLSSCPSDAYSMTDLVIDLEELLDHIGVSQSSLVGLSIGGMIGQLLAHRQPDRMTRLILACTAAKMGTADMWQARITAVHKGGVESIADAVLDRWFSGPFRHSDECIAWRNMLNRTPADGYIGCSEALAATDLTATTSELTLPVLGLAGSEDLASPPAQVKATTDLIRDSRFVEIDGAGHLPCVEQADVFTAHLKNFLKESAHVRQV
jgi:3-oxoadipate enol-lactonase